MTQEESIDAEKRQSETDQLRADLAASQRNAQVWEQNYNKCHASLCAVNDRENEAVIKLTAAREEIMRKDQIFAAHTKAVERFLSEMYCTMIDPLADGQMKVAETTAVLLKAAQDQRQREHDARAALEKAPCGCTTSDGTPFAGHGSAFVRIWCARCLALGLDKVKGEPDGPE